MARIPVTRNISIDESELEETFVRASGPGGQHVNKSSTAVQLRFDAARSPSLPQDVRERLLKLAGSRRTADGEIVIDARRYRSQDRNREDARERLVALIHRAASPPPKRRPTRPSKAAKRARLQDKRYRANIKRLRGRTPSAED